MSATNGVLPPGVGTITYSGQDELWAQSPRVVFVSPLVVSSIGVGVSQFSFVTVDFATAGPAGGPLPSGNYIAYCMARAGTFASSVPIPLSTAVSWDAVTGQVIGSGSVVTSIGLEGRWYANSTNSVPDANGILEAYYKVSAGATPAALPFYLQIALMSLGGETAPPLAVPTA
jgi:hypothetical protein